MLGFRSVLRENLRETLSVRGRFYLKEINHSEARGFAPSWGAAGVAELFLCELLHGFRCKRRDYA